MDTPLSTTGIMSTTLVLPVEIWEHIISCLRNDYAALQACLRVCRSWHDRSLFHLLTKSHLYHRSQVLRLSKMARSQPRIAPMVREVIVGRGEYLRHRANIHHLGAFAAMLARKCTSMEQLTLQGAEWRAGDVHPDIFLHLSAFSSITSLNLCEVTFPSVVVFGRLVFALHNIESLQCYDIIFKTAGRFEKLALPNAEARSRLTRLTLESDLKSITHIINFLLITRIASRLTNITFVDYTSRQRASYIAHSTQASAAVLVQRLLQIGAESIRELSFTPDTRVYGLDEPTIQDHLNLGHNTKLQCLRLTLDLRLYPRYEINFDWVSKFMRRITSDSIRELVVAFDARFVEYDWPPDAFRTSKDWSCWPLIEEVLSRSQFGNLRRVVLDVWKLADYPVVDEVMWSEAVRSRLPLLHQRGILQTSVSVHLR